MPLRSRKIAFLLSIMNVEDKAGIMYRTGIGHDSHRFLSPDSSKPCILAGCIFDVPGLAADSDGDVVFHSICNAVTSLTGVRLIDGIAEDLYRKEGVTDSQAYVELALECLEKANQKIVHVSLTLEGKRPRFRERIEEMRENTARVLKVDLSQVGLTVTSGAGLTDFGCGDGIQGYCVMTVKSCGACP